jgi:pyrroline-5-carboxylate reductase
MAFINTVKTGLTLGVPTEYVNSLAVALTVGTVTTALTGFANYIRSGKWRVKVTTPNGGQITAIKVTVTDGTNTETVYQDAIARTINENVDIVNQFISELNVTTVNIAITAATATITADLEVTGNP